MGGFGSSHGTFLAAALGEYPDDWLAAEVSCLPEHVWQLRLTGLPLGYRWADDVERMAGVLSADVPALDGLRR